MYLRPRRSRKVHGTHPHPLRGAVAHERAAAFFQHRWLVRGGNGALLHASPCDSPSRPRHRDGKAQFQAGGKSTGRSRDERTWKILTASASVKKRAKDRVWAVTAEPAAARASRSRATESPARSAWQGSV